MYAWAFAKKNLLFSMHDVCFVYTRHISGTYTVTVCVRLATEERNEDCGPCDVDKMLFYQRLMLKVGNAHFASRTCASVSNTHYLLSASACSDHQQMEILGNHTSFLWFIGITTKNEEQDVFYCVGYAIIVESSKCPVKLLSKLFA